MNAIDILLPYLLSPLGNPVYDNNTSGNKLLSRDLQDHGLKLHFAIVRPVAIVILATKLTSAIQIALCLLFKFVHKSDLLQLVKSALFLPFFLFIFHLLKGKRNLLHVDS